MRFFLVSKRLVGALRLVKFMFTNKGVTMNYQMGKVGSSSIGEWFRQNEVGEWHIHRFFDTPVHSNRGKNKALKVLDLLLFKLLKITHRKIKIVTGVRFPLERDISMYFHNAFGIEKRPLPASGKVGEVIADFNKAFPVLACVNWFDDELKQLTGIDIFDYPFDQEKGFSIIDTGKYQVFVYRLDKLNSLQDELSIFFEEPDFELINMNNSGTKRYLDLYRDFQTAYARESQFLLDDERAFVEKFYDPKLVSEYRRRWATQG